MLSAIINYKNNIGLTLSEQIKTFDGYDKDNIEQIRNLQYDNVYCCPTIDDIEYLYSNISTVKCKNFFLVSVQECNSTLDSNELYTTDPMSNVGKAFLNFENFCKGIFNTYILRIGMPFGSFKCDNILYDLMYFKYPRFQCDYTIQIYPLDMLYSDLKRLQLKNKHIENRFSEPILISDIIEKMNHYGYSYYSHLTLELDESKCHRNKGNLLIKLKIFRYLKECINTHRNKLFKGLN